MEIINNMEVSPFDLLFKQSVPHILEKIFLHLDYSSFRSCLLVNKRWKQVFISGSETFKRMGKSKFEEWLFKAAMTGQVDAVHLLLYLGADPDRYMGKYSGKTALHWAATLNRIEIVKLLLDAGADPNRWDTYKKSPLHYAVNCSKTRSIVVKMLMDSGADPNLRDDLGYTYSTKHM